MDWLQIQTRLRELGFDPGPLDGIYGRRTKAAVAAFQRSRDIPVRFPGTVDLGSGNSKTLKALFPEYDDLDQEPAPEVKMPWLAEAVAKMGWHERTHNKKLRKWLKSDGATLGDPAKLPWCGDFVETCIALTLPEEPLPVNPYLAANWGKFGVSTLPTVGCVADFWRGSPSSWKGHVAFIVGGNSRNYLCLGGNQRNTISVVPISKRRLRAARWPMTVPKQPINLPWMADNGKISVNEY